MNVSHTYRQFLFFLIKLAIVIGSFYFIYQKTIHNKSISLTDFIILLESKLNGNYKVISIVLLGTLLNWFFEILKWKILVFSIQKISFITALKQSLGSLTASLFTPNRIGEYAAKAIYYPKKKRKKIVLLNLISNVSQMTITILFGLFGLLFFILHFNVEFPILKSKKFVYYLAIIVTFFFGGRYFISKKIRGFYVAKIVSFFRSLSTRLVFKTILFSMLRYLVFSHQFYFLLRLFGVETDYYTLIMLVFSMYLIASVIPSMPMFDWLIKGSVAVYIFTFVGVNEFIVVSITSLMWLLNFAFPAIIGSYFVLNFRFLDERKTSK